MSVLPSPTPHASRWLLVLGASLLLSLGAAPRASAGAPPGYVPSGYFFEDYAEAGWSFSATKSGVSSLPQLLQLALDDLTAIGMQPTPKRAFESELQPGAGLATIAALFRRSPLDGVVFAALEGNEGKVAVVLSGPETSGDGWRRLLRVRRVLSAPKLTPVSAAKTATLAKAGLEIKHFRDGSAYVGLPPGWVTNLESARTGVEIQGPNDQHVSLWIGYSVRLPEKAEADILQHFNGTLVASYGSPRKVLEQLAPQLSQLAVKRGMGAFTVDELRVVKNRLPEGPLKTAQQALLRYRYRESKRRYQVEAQVEETFPEHGDRFDFFFRAALRAPDKTFARDLPLMRKIASSFQPNNEQAARDVQAEGVPSSPAPRAAEAFDDVLRNALLLTTPPSDTNPVLAAAANADSLVTAVEQSGQFRTLTLPGAPRDP